MGRLSTTECTYLPTYLFLSLPLPPPFSLSLSLLWQASKASAQNSVHCSRASGSQHTVHKSQYHQMIKVRYQSLGTKLVSTHKLGGFLLYPQAGRVPTKHLARLGC